MRCRIVVSPTLKELEELFGAPLLKQAHKRTLDSLHLCTRDFGDLAISEDKATGDLFELEVASDIGVNKDLSELSRCDDEFGNKIDGVISVSSKLCRGSLIGSKFAIELVAT